MLEEYNKKRNFNNTSEPKGKTNSKSKTASKKAEQTTKKSKTKQNIKPKKFVVQYHDATREHYDLRLEHNGVLLSWAVPKGLSQNPKDKRLAVHVEDHPQEYGNFEGIIPKGNYGAGVVEIFDKGNYVALESFSQGIKKGHLKFVLNGKKLKGAWSLVRTDEKNWIAVKIDDEFAKNSTKKDGEKANKTSLKKLKNPFKECAPQLATLSHSLPKGKDWLFEIKYDGYRVLAFIENGKVKMLTRNGKDYTKKFPVISKNLLKLSDKPFVLDGEIVAFDKAGKSNFGLLQESIKTDNKNLYYVVFDLLALGGEDLRKKPLLDRKKLLEKLLVKAPNNIMFSKFVLGKGKEIFTFAKRNNLEGVIAKKSSSNYVQKRTEDWLKIKCYKRQEFVIGGFTTTDKNKYLSAILVGYYNKNKLIFVGKVGTGFDEKLKKELNKKFEKLIRKTSPFSDEINEKNATWLTPQLVAEIQFAEITKNNILRQPSFVGLREDKNPKQVVLEKELWKQL